MPEKKPKVDPFAVVAEASAEKDTAVATPPSPVEMPLAEFTADELTAEELAIIADDPTADDDVIPPWDK